MFVPLLSLAKQGVFRDGYMQRCESHVIFRLRVSAVDEFKQLDLLVERQKTAEQETVDVNHVDFTGL